MSNQSSNHSSVASKTDLLEKTPRLTKDIPRPKTAVLIEKLVVKPAEQKRVPLGSFTENTPPKGFLVEIDPDPNPVESVVTQTTRLETTTGYRLTLHVANYGSKTVQAAVWQL